MTEATKYIATTADGRYGLTKGNDLYRIASPESAAQYAADIAADPELGRLLGTDPDYFVGAVFDAENIETAADAADEEMRVLMADARVEFGF